MPTRSCRLVPVLLLAGLGGARSAGAQPPPVKVEVQPDSPIGARIGEMAPDFRLKTLSGAELSLAALNGHPVIINFWASWCPPCRVEMPLLIAAYQAHRDSGLEIVAVNMTDQESWKDIRKFVAEFAMPFAVALDANGKTRDRYGLIALPTTVFVGGDGMVRVSNSGPIDAATLKRHLAQILPPP